MCYQATFGAEHALTDVSAAREYFYKEFDLTPEKDIPLIEQISSDFCRVNIAAWKFAKLKAEWLFNMFVLSASLGNGSDDGFIRRLYEAEEYIGRENIENYLNGGIRAVHHSENYRAAEKPAYRVVAMRIARLIPILQRVNDDTHVIAFDGRAAAGKTEAAKAFCFITGAAAVHMDDFFLPTELRTEERLAEAGGNVHYERFSEEILPFIKCKDGFSYRVFDCSKMALCGMREVKAADLRVVEGAYSMHPYFGDYADIKVFFDVDADEQMRRIFLRNGENMARMFKERWIPMEEKYHARFGIREKADITV